MKQSIQWKNLKASQINMIDFRGLLAYYDNYGFIGEQLWYFICHSKTSLDAPKKPANGPFLG